MHNFVFIQSDGVGYNSKDFNIVINKKPSLIKPKKILNTWR
ncbi:hypothetical protein [Clostridium tetani]|nr:hypothetical protein [Clostridium tetani]